MFYIQQSDEHDCGFTCLKIMLANIHHDHNYLFLPSPFDTSKSVSFLSLMKEGEKYGVKLSALRALDKDELPPKDKLPFITRMEINEVSHALYIYKISNKYVYCYDPSYGKRKININEFTLTWSGEILLIEEYQKMRCPVIKPKFMKNHETLISLGLSLLAAISSVLAVYFINKESYIYLPLIFFSLMIISEVALKAYSIRIMKNVDQRVETITHHIKNEDYYDYYLTYEGYKKYLLVNQISYFSSFYIFLLISLVFIINDKINVIYILINLVLASSYTFFIRPILDKEEKEIMYQEAVIKKADGVMNAFIAMDSARERAYKYVNKEYAFKCVVIAIQIILTFIMMIYMNLVSVTYIICNTVLQIYLYNNVVSLLNKNTDLEKQDNLLNKIINYIENK